MLLLMVVAPSQQEVFVGQQLQALQQAVQKPPMGPEPVVSQAV